MVRAVLRFMQGGMRRKQGVALGAGGFVAAGDVARENRGFVS